MNKGKKNIWIFHHYATPPTLSGLTRPYHFGKQLLNNGYDVTVFSASYLHFSNENVIRDNEEYIVSKDTEVPFVYINTPSSETGLKRVLNMVAFYRRLFSVAKSYMKDHPKPDLIIASSPHPLVMVAGIKIAKRLGIPCICEVRDFWPEVFFIGGALKEQSLLGKTLIKGEHWIYKKADGLIFLKEGDHQYILSQKWSTEQGGDIDLNKCYYINNGVDIENHDRLILENTLHDSDLERNKFNVIYTGAIRPVNDVGKILDAAKLLQDEKDIQFLIYGDGSQKDMLQQRIANEQLRNVKMKGYIEKKYIPYVLSKSSVNVLNYSQSKYNWSRGNSSNKLFEYMASGKPIISTVKMGYSPIDKYNCGLSLEEDNPESLAKAILKIYQMPKEKYEVISSNAKQGANDFDFKVLGNKLIDVLENYI